MDQNSIMPFGAHKGKPMKDIPPHYLQLLHSQIQQKSKLHWTLTDKLLNKYINENINKANSNATK